MSTLFFARYFHIWLAFWLHIDQPLRWSLDIIKIILFNIIFFEIHKTHERGSDEGVVRYGL